jgi:polysaccharide export outer membrane protein
VDKRYTLQFLTCLALAASLFISAGVQAEVEKPANLNEHDKGITLPISLVKGRVTNQTSRYILGPGDKISLKIRDLDQFNQSFTIRPDGYATIHPFGEHRLSGTDIQGLQSLLVEEFKLYLLKPQISVDVTEMRPALIYVSGAVQRPGTYQFTRSTNNISVKNGPIQEGVELTLTNVLGKTGGVTLNADIGNIQIVHASTGEKETFNLRDFLAGNSNQRDIWLLPEDNVIVPEATQPMESDTFKLISNSTYFREKFPVVVLGAVQRQGEIQMDPTNNSLNAAIAQAGGFVAGLSKRDAVIVQRPDAKGSFNRWVIQRDKSNLALMPGDVVYIPDSKVAWMERGFHFLGSISQPYYFGLSGANVIKNQLIQFPLP